MIFRPKNGKAKLLKPQSWKLPDPDASENHMTAATRLLEKKREMLELEQVTKVDEGFLSQEIVNIVIQRYINYKYL